MSLQLYQVDHRSFLLDFKSLPNEETEDYMKGIHYNIYYINIYDIL